MTSARVSGDRVLPLVERHDGGGGPGVRPFDAEGVDAFVRRLRGTYEEIHPRHWHIDWSAVPSPFRWYESAPRTDLPALPRGAARGEPTAVSALARSAPLARLGALLHAAYGVTGIRWYPEGIAKSSPDEPVPVHRNPHYQLRRPVPSGGVTYPAECYVLAGRGSGVPAGVHHYDAARHALATVAAAVPDPAPRGSVRLVLTVPLWKNHFKYGDFAYRLGCLDTGAVLGQFLAVARSWGWASSVRMALDETALLHALGLDPSLEAAPAVVDVEVGPAGTAPAVLPAVPAGATGRGARWRGASAPPPADGPMRRMHAACLAAARPDRALGLPVIDDPALPADTTLPAPGAPDPLPLDAWHRVSLGEQFRAGAVDAPTLTSWIAWMRTGVPTDDLAGARAGLRHLRVVVLARAVEGLAPGAHLALEDGTSATGARLAHLTAGDLGGEVQRSLFGAYMNFTQVPVVFALAGATDAHRTGGPVAYRAQHLLAGVAAQRLAAAATRDGMSAHPVLGFISSVVDRAAGLDRLGLTSLLLVAVGGYRRAPYLENGLHPATSMGRIPS